MINAKIDHEKMTQKNTLFEAKIEKNTISVSVIKVVILDASMF